LSLPSQTLFNARLTAVFFAADLRADRLAAGFFGWAEVAGGSSEGIVAAGLGLTALPKLALQLTRHDDLATVPLQRPAVSRAIGLVTRAGRSPSPVSRAFMDLLQHK
jgi:DNA-binding transcriptional LysR family regulator